MATLLNGGVHPFVDSKDQEAEVKRRVLKGELNLAKIACSEGARNLLLGLLNIYPAERLDAASALLHPWIKLADKLGGGGLAGDALYQFIQVENKTSLAIKAAILLVYLRRRAKLEPKPLPVRLGDGDKLAVGSASRQDSHNGSAKASERAGPSDPQVSFSKRRLPAIPRDRLSHLERAAHSSIGAQPDRDSSKLTISPEKERPSAPTGASRDRFGVSKFNSIGRLHSPKFSPAQLPYPNRDSPKARHANSRFTFPTQVRPSRASPPKQRAKD